MLAKATDKRAPPAEIVTTEDLVPDGHLLRSVAAAIDFGFIYKLVDEKYSLETGRPNIAPRDTGEDGVHPVPVWNTEHAPDGAGQRGERGLPVFFQNPMCT